MNCGGHGGCLDELAWYMHNRDIISNLSGDQNVDTYTIAGFGGAPPALMTSTANHGGGQYYAANNASELNDALNDILLRVNTEDSTFASPATTTSAFNSLQTSEDVYFIMFKPDVGPGWTGNLKRYRLGSDNQIYDANGALAIDPLTGFFKETAKSFWSTVVDGKTVGLGGMAEKITQSRSLYSDISGTSNVALNTTGNQLHEDNTSITSQMLGQSINSSERTLILKWGRGVDVDDEDSDGSTTDHRTSIGDPLHTQPRVITYFKNATGSVVDKTIYFTTNDGFLHAVDSSDGSTEFAYIPKSLLENLKKYRDGYINDSSLKEYGQDGPMTVWLNDLNSDGDVLQSDNGNVDIGEHIYLYTTMRRGGNNIHALDVTDRENPVLKWIIKGDLDNNQQADSTSSNPDFNELGQTWSSAKLARVQWNGNPTRVLFFGGGYDSDTDDQTTIQNNDLGRAIYMVNAETGAKLWSAGKQNQNLNLSQLNYSIPADVTLVDINQDDLVDYLFAVDVGGQIIRFDINPSNTGASNFATGGVIAKLSGTSSADARRFFEAPDVIIGKDSEYLNIAVGSGFRANPLSTTVDDRMYVIRDPNVFESPASYHYASGNIITESSLYNATENLIQQGSSTQQQVALASLDSSHGWMMELEVNGEKVLSKPKVFKGVLLFNSFAPRSSSAATCGPQPGENYFYAVDIEDASATFNLDTASSSLQKSDRNKMLQHSTLAPESSILTRSNEGAEICVGTECFQDTLQSLGSVPVNRNFWKENR